MVDEDPMTRADLIAAVRTVKPYLSERECLAIVRGVLGVVREPSREMCAAGDSAIPRFELELDGSRLMGADGAADCFTAMIDTLLGEVGE